jgi:hypothetical protein
MLGTSSARFLDSDSGKKIGLQMGDITTIRLVQNAEVWVENKYPATTMRPNYSNCLRILGRRVGSFGISYDL